ncbi:MAG: DUF3488 and transglutaminase-like domain-containing protein [Eubacteriales bacterium]
MKNKLWLTHLLGACFAFLFAVTAVGCLATGWELNIASPHIFILWCGLFSVLPPILLYFRYGGWALLFLSVCGAFSIWHDGVLWEQLQTFAHIVSIQIGKYYKFPVLGAQISEEFDLFLILLAYLTAVSVSFCICKRWNSLIALPLPILSLAICVITIGTLPDERILFLLMLGIVLLLLTDWVRRKNPGQFASLLLMTVIPTAAALALLFGLSPREEYVCHIPELQKKAATLIEQLKSAASEAAEKNAGIEFTKSFTSPTLNLQNVGPRNNLSFTVMRVTSTYDGVVYLRGRDYDVYTGLTWESSEERTEYFTAGSAEKGTITIETTTARDIFYTPYYTVDSLSLTDGYSDNPERDRTYSYAVSLSPMEKSGTAPDYSVYTKLPEETSEGTKIIAGGASARYIAEFVEMYVQNSAEYDLNTPHMDSGYTDFARWFLEENNTGYCVHFATAAAVLLRTAGIPARFVEGYMVSCKANETVTVTNHNAHAWVEYYDKEASVWRILEATPADATVTETEAIEPDAETISEETTPDIPPIDEETPEDAEENFDAAETESQEIPPENPDDTSSSANGIGENTGAAHAAKEPFRMPEWVKTVLKSAAKILLIILLIPAQAYIRIALKRKIWNSGSPNVKTIHRWRQSRRLARSLKLRMPAELDELALKAKFSQHTITEDELALFDRFRGKISGQVDAMPWHRKIFFRWILAVK